MKKPYRIILADDHSMFRAGLRTLIEKEDKLSVVDEACDGEDLLKKLKGGKCDLVVIDLSMPKMDGITALKQISKKYPRIKVLVLTMQKDTSYFRDAMAQGASGYLLKDDAFEQLVKAIDTVLNNEQFLSPSILGLVKEQVSDPEKLSRKKDPNIEVLTKREQQVLKLVAAGLANKNIAHQLDISIRTVEVHRSNLTKKLKIKTTAGLVKYAIANAFVD